MTAALLAWRVFIHLQGWSFFVFALLYFVPTVIALVRKGRYQWPAVIVDVLLGWTLIGWLIALGLAIPGRDAHRSVRSAA